MIPVANPIMLFDTKECDETTPGHLNALKSTPNLL
jgi:hypothetical protein